MKDHFPGLKKLFSTKDIAAKIICILLSIILWAYLSSTDIGEIKYKIPISFVNLPVTLVKSRISDKYITATLTGRKDSLKNINIKSLKAVVNLGQPEIGLNKSYPVEVVREEIPENIDLVLSAKEVSLVVERKIYKKVKVKVNIIDKVIGGYIIGKIMVIPDSINISGPESVIKRIDFVRTDRISVANASVKLIKDVAISDKDLPDITAETSKVRVIIPIIESANLFEFRKIILLKNMNDKYNYIPSQEDVSVYLQSDVPNMEPAEEDVDVFADVITEDLDAFFHDGNENFIEKNCSIEVVTKKAGIKIVSILPDVISIKIMEK
ncbi:MAG: CdaR family protein [Spirochaetota bacterium]